MMHLAVVASMKKGLEQFIYREIRALAANGATISLFPTKHGPGLYNPPPEWRVHRWHMAAVLLSQPWRFLRAPMRYAATLAQSIRDRAVVDFLMAAYFAPHIKSADVIYATFGDRKLFVGYYCKLLVDKPLAVEIHAYELYQNPNPKLFPKALAACDRVIAATDYNRELLCSRFGVEPRRVEVVRYVLDLDDFRPTSKFVVLIVAFFVEKKGHDTLLKAVKKMNRDDVELWIVGGSGGSTSEVDVHALVRNLGMDSQVAFFGKLSGTALKAMYRACDVFCHPSRFDSQGEAEGFPNTIVEAMACGKPVVTTRHVEIPRIVEQILVDENDVDALAEALEQVYQSTELRKELGRRNRELAETHFSTSNASRTFELLNQITGREPAAPLPALSHGVRSPATSAQAT
jgi:colanic acid/amylovoran biosynthesis glycosyltransferase